MGIQLKVVVHLLLFPPQSTMQSDAQQKSVNIIHETLFHALMLLWHNYIFRVFPKQGHMKINIIHHKANPYVFASIIHP